MSDPRFRTLKIKTGVLKRLAKEKLTYEKEAVQQRERLETYKEQGKDSHMIKKQEEVLQETLMMVPDCQRRLLKAFEELEKLLETEEELKESEVYIDAKTIVEEARVQINERN